MLKIIVFLVSIIDTINLLYPVLSPLVFALIFIFDREKLEVKFDALAKFIAFLILFGAIKMCLWNGAVLHNKYNLDMRGFLFVFLEDAFYAMIPYYLTKRISNQKINIAVWVFFSIIFGTAHRYQGITGVFVTSFYPYFVSNKIAQRTSFGTVMAGHFLWDCFVFLLPAFNNLMNIML